MTEQSAATTGTVPGPPARLAALIAIIALGLVMLLVARFILRSPFFSIRRESDTQAG